MLASDLLRESPSRDPVGRSIWDVGCGTGRRHERSIPTTTTNSASWRIL